MKKNPPPPDVYEIVRSILENHGYSPASKEKIKEEIKKKVLPDGTIEAAYGFATRAYLNGAIERADLDQASVAFWGIFIEDFKKLLKDDQSKFYIPYYALQLEGLYDVVLLDEKKSLAPYGDNRGIAGPPPLPYLSFQWLRDIVDHTENEGKPVLIIGDTGTGKEAMARAIHKLSERKEKKLTTLNCAAIPENLLESELFGYEKGAFTGATELKKGLIEESNQGTLFLDEIGKTSLYLQSKILRFVEGKKQKFRRLGGTKDIIVNVRIIAAIHTKVVNDEKHFLPDLKYRFGYPYCINMPTLNEKIDQFKGDDSHKIFSNSLNVVLNRLEMRDKILQYKISAEAFKLLGAHNYTGNYRELENILMSAVYSAKRKGKDIIRKEDLSLLKPMDRNNEGANTASEIKLKDIFSYADKVKSYIVSAKIQEVIDSGRDIKNVLDNEYKQEGKELLTHSQYVQWTKDIKTVTGKKINDFKKMRKNRE